MMRYITNVTHILVFIVFGLLKLHVCVSITSQVRIHLITKEKNHMHIPTLPLHASPSGLSDLFAA